MLTWNAIVLHLKKCKQTIITDSITTQITQICPYSATTIDPRYHNLKFRSTQQWFSHILVYIIKKSIQLSEELLDDSQNIEECATQSGLQTKRPENTALHFPLGNCYDQEVSKVRRYTGYVCQARNSLHLQKPMVLEWWKIIQHHCRRNWQNICCSPHPPLFPPQLTDREQTKTKCYKNLPKASKWRLLNSPWTILCKHYLEQYTAVSLLSKLIITRYRIM